MTDKELEALLQGAAISREEAEVLFSELWDAETLVESVKRNMPMIIAEHLRRENEQFDKLFKHGRMD